MLLFLVVNIFLQIDFVVCILVSNESRFQPAAILTT